MLVKVDRKHAASTHGGLQKQIAQVAGKDLDRMCFGPIGQFAAHFAFQARNDQPLQCVAPAAAQKVGVRMFGRHQQFVCRGLHGLLIGVDLDPQQLGLFAVRERKHPQ